MGAEKVELSKELLDLVSGGKLDSGWEKTVDDYIYTFLGTNDPKEVQKFVKNGGVSGYIQTMINYAKSILPAEDQTKILNYIKNKYGVSL